MNEYLVSLINRHSEYIDNDEWEDLYAALYDELEPRFGTGDDILGEFTAALLEADINPLESASLTYVPEYYLYGQTIDQVVIPSHIVSINDHAYGATSGYDKLVVPGHVDCINTYAFYDCSAKEIILEEGVVILGEGAFAGCENLQIITIPLSCGLMHDNIFQDCPEELIIRCYAGSRAEAYAKEYDINYEIID